MSGIRASGVLPMKEGAALTRLEQAFAVQGRGNRDARGVQQGGHDIPEFSQAIADPPPRADHRLRPPEQQRNMRAALIGAGFAAQAMIGQQLPMIGGKHHDGVVVELLIHQPL